MLAVTRIRVEKTPLASIARDSVGFQGAVGITADHEDVRFALAGFVPEECAQAMSASARQRRAS